MSAHPRQRRITLLVNPGAGHGRARRRLPAVRDALAAALPGHGVEVVETSSYADARRLARAATASAAPGDALVTMGGDGMTSVGINACATTGVPLGVVPAGTGNDFCRGVGLPVRIDEAVRVIAAGHTRAVDVMRLDGALPDGADHQYVGSVLSTGFDEKVNWRANHLPFTLGAPSYAWSVFAELREFRPLRYRIEVDGVRRELPAILIAVGNAGIFGGGIRIHPDADVTDGLLDVTIVHPVGRGTLLRLFPQLFTGRFTHHPAIETLRARRVVVDGDDLFGMADGEDLGRPPFTATAVQGALCLFAPEAG